MGIEPTSERWEAFNVMGLLCRSRQGDPGRNTQVTNTRDRSWQVAKRYFSCEREADSPVCWKE